MAFMNADADPTCYSLLHRTSGTCAAEVKKAIIQNPQPYLQAQWVAVLATLRSSRENCPIFRYPHGVSRHATPIPSQLNTKSAQDGQNRKKTATPCSAFQLHSFIEQT